MLPGVAVPMAGASSLGIGGLAPKGDVAGFGSGACEVIGLAENKGVGWMPTGGTAATTACADGGCDCDVSNDSRPVISTPLVPRPSKGLDAGAEVDAMLGLLSPAAGDVHVSCSEGLSREVCCTATRMRQQAGQPLMPQNEHLMIPQHQSCKLPQTPGLC